MQIEPDVVRGEVAARYRPAPGGARMDDEQLTRILMGIPALIAILDGPDYIHTFANPRYLEVLGLPDGQVLGRPLHAVLPDPAGRQLLALLDQVRASGQPLEVRELALPLGPVGDQHEAEAILDLALQPVVDADGEVRGVHLYAVDVTEPARARREQARRLASERAARLAAEAAHQQTLGLIQGLDAIIWEADAATFRFTFVSQRAEALLGYPVERWLEEPRFWADHIHPADRDWAVNFCVDCTARGEDHQFEYRMLAADGHVVWVRDVVHVEVDAHKRPVRLRGVMVDITEQKRAEQRMAVKVAVANALVEAESVAAGTARLLGAIGESLGWPVGAFWLFDAQAGGLRCVDFWQRPDVAASALRESCHASVFALGEGLPGRVWATGAAAWVRDVAREAALPRAPLLRASGLRSAFGFPVVSPGRVLGVIEFFGPEVEEPDEQLLALMGALGALFGQFVERRWAEERLREEREALEIINRVGRMLSAELDLDRLVQAVTDAATELTGAQFGAFFYNVVNEHGEGYTLYALSGAPREAFEGFPLPHNSKLFEPTYRGQGVVRLDDVTRDPRYGKSPPYYGMPPGHLPVRSYLAVPVISRSGEVLGGLFFGHAQPGVFTERAERLVSGIAAQAAIAIDNARLYRQVQDALRTRDEFLSSAAHDLRTPLTNIKGLSQLLRRRARRGNALDGEWLNAALASIDASATQISEQVDQLSDLTRLQMGQPLEIERRPTDLVELARRVASEQQSTTGRHQIRVHAPTEPIVGLWDGVRLARVVHNLVANAIKYSPEGGDITVTVARDREGDDPWAVLHVQDQGLGIPAADLPRIFERFQRASNVIGRIGGTGIGLASARQIIEQHGGRITVSSREGHGSRFTVRLPLAGSDRLGAGVSGQGAR